MFPSYREKKHIAIKSYGSINPWGVGKNLKGLFSKNSYVQPQPFNGKNLPVAAISKTSDKKITQLRNSKKPYKHLDRSVLLGILAAREVMNGVSPKNDERIGINIGSSRGATETFEKHYKEYLESSELKTAPHTSPTTTLGNISSWVMADLQLNGPVLSHSITCSTTIQALANGMAWLKSGMADRFLAGGTEAPLTAFTLAQMEALKIYSKDTEKDYPCQPLAKNPFNGMVLGEGAASFLLEGCSWEEFIEQKEDTLLESAGFGNEPLEGFTGISEDGTCFQKAMQMALDEQDTGFDVDMILIHAPGTIKGDQAEMKAIKKIFGHKEPMLYSNKWQIGHTFGASAALSLIQAIEILNSQQIPQFPYPAISSSCIPPIRKIMINAAGFGGNAGSIIVSKPF